ncbi:restriction endonuclease [Clostridium botulinum]|uniref:Uncharacterized protein n=1 Tax=Clostridium botulinum TaxID=1491 RepID=A0ABD7CM48_CLOBO|nr:restriction endonuclease [Clostridium botulinum]QRI54304.1 hypothetical protein JQS73_04075 [Clostridium botulinum]
MIETMMKGYEFETLIGDLFKHYGYVVENNKTIIKNHKIYEADLISSNNIAS